MKGSEALSTSRTGHTQSLNSVYLMLSWGSFLFSDRWVSAMPRPWRLILAVCSLKCLPVWTSCRCNMSSTRRWGGQGIVGGTVAWYRPFMLGRTKHYSTCPPSPLPVTRSCLPRPLPSWWLWRHPELRANGGPPHLLCSKASRSFDILLMEKWKHKW